MNEYQDQTLWWEVQTWKVHRWVYVSDHDSEGDARDWAKSYKTAFPDNIYRVERVYGLS